MFLIVTSETFLSHNCNQFFISKPFNLQNEFFYAKILFSTSAIPYRKVYFKDRKLYFPTSIWRINLTIFYCIKVTSWEFFIRAIQQSYFTIILLKWEGRNKKWNFFILFGACSNGRICRRDEWYWEELIVYDILWLGLF